MACVHGPVFAVVVAHPDDDAFTWAGTVALHAQDPDFRFVLIHATNGEAGDIRPGFPATRDTLGRIRRRECEAAWRPVGRPPDRHDWLGGVSTLDIGQKTTIGTDDFDLRGRWDIALGEGPFLEIHKVCNALGL